MSAANKTSDSPASTARHSLRGAIGSGKCWRCATVLMNLLPKRGRPGPAGTRMTGWCTECAERVDAIMFPNTELSGGDKH